MPILDTLADCHRAVMTDDSFGERVRILPFGADGRRDRSRPEATIVAVYRSAAERDLNASGGVRQDWSVRTEAGEASLYIDIGAYPDLAIEDGDHIQLIERAGMPFAEIANVNRRNAPRIIVSLRETSR